MSNVFRGSLVALVTPMDAQGQIDFVGLSRLIDWHLQSGTHGFVVMGTTGEAATLSFAEQCQVIEHAVRQVGGRVPVIAGTGTHCTRVSIERSQQAARLGVDACLVVTPYYVKPTQQGLFEHYQAIAAATDVPILLYNVPGRTGCDLLPETVARLARVEGIVGLKEAVPDRQRIETLLSVVDKDFSLLSGDDLTALTLLQAGGHGVISVTANVVPDWMVALYRAQCEQGNRPLAEQIDACLQPLHQALFVESNPIPCKWLVSEIKQLEHGIRRPLTPLASVYQAEVRSAYQQLQTQAELITNSITEC